MRELRRRYHKRPLRRFLCTGGPSLRRAVRKGRQWAEVQVCLLAGGGEMGGGGICGMGMGMSGMGMGNGNERDGRK